MAQPTLNAFQVIADASRRQMLMLLSKDSLTINSLAEKLNDVFTVRFSGGTFVTFEVTESVHGEKIAWQVTECYLPWLKDKTEWNGTTIVFEISPLGHETQVRMTHVGLVPEVECYEGCEAGWNKYFKGSLFKLLTEHIGVPQ